jgi:hypothetical protein
MKTKKRLLIFFCLLLITAIVEPVMLPTKTQAETIYMPPEKSREELYQDIFISLILPKIDERVAKYYKNVLTKPPMVYPYMVYIENAERIGDYRSFEFLLTVKVYPVVGPHIEVGQDRLKIYVAGSGQVQIKNFQHIKDYELPDHWKNIKKQPAPKPL